MTKATHYGTCQSCGSFQKLPGGALALHGYTKEWGFFNGTCSGSRHLPFEKSRDYAKECIVKARRDAAHYIGVDTDGARAKAAALRCYISWQTDRVASWTPGTLVEVKAEEARERKARKVRSERPTKASVKRALRALNRKLEILNAEVRLEVLRIRDGGGEDDKAAYWGLPDYLHNYRADNYRAVYARYVPDGVERIDQLIEAYEEQKAVPEGAAR